MANRILRINRGVLLETSIVCPVARIVAKSIYHNRSKILNVEHNIPGHLSAEVLYDYRIGCIEHFHRHVIVMEDYFGFPFCLGLVREFLLDDWDML
jgi:hypothetical protein